MKLQNRQSEAQFQALQERQELYEKAEQVIYVYVYNIYLYLLKGAVIVEHVQSL